MDAGKIVIVGPPGVGKTSLRKVFFEGTSAKYILDYAIEPTHGQESILLNLDKKIGVFDLAGQENYRWFESEEKNIFVDAKIIITVLETGMDDDEIIRFAKKVIEIRDELTPDSIIYLFIHKIDLVSQEELVKRQINLSNIFTDVPQLRITFTSITESFFSSTLAIFIDILKIVLGKEEFEIDINLELLKKIFQFLYNFKDENSISRKTLQDRLFFSDDKMDEIIAILKEKKHLEVTMMSNEAFLGITHDGKSYFNEVLKRFDINKLKEIESQFLGKDVRPDLEMPPFLGFFLSDKDGKTLFTVEEQENILKEYFTNQKSDNPLFDIELIPMFISALEKFSQEINIKDMAGFKLKGKNQTMQIFTYDYYTFTLFTNPNINLKPIKDKIQSYFEEMINSNKKLFDTALSTGSIDPILPFSIKSKEWLTKLNEDYQEMIINYNIIDFDQAKTLYKKLDTILENIQKKYEDLEEEVKELKVNLMKSILEDKMEDIRQISQNIQELVKKYA